MTTTTITTSMAAELKALTDAGFSIEDAIKAYTAIHGDVQPKAEKATKATTTEKVQPKAEVEKVGGITRVRKSKTQPKAESKATTTAKPKANAENGKALMLNSKFNIEKTARTDDPSVAVWRVSLVERVEKSDWSDLSRYLGAEFDAGYWKGAWTFCFDPSKVLAGGKLTKTAEKAIAKRRAERVASREAKKAAKRA